MQRNQNNRCQQHNYDWRLQFHDVHDKYFQQEHDNSNNDTFHYLNADLPGDYSTPSYITLF